jgi:hypothetical protein
VKAPSSARALHLGLHAPCPHEQRATVFGQQHPARAALEQLDAELLLDLVDGPGDGGLRPEQRGAGPIRAALIGDGKERPHLAQLGLHRFRRLKRIRRAPVYRDKPPVSG